VKTKRGGVRKFREERRIMVERMPLRRTFLGDFDTKSSWRMVPEAEILKVKDFPTEDKRFFSLSH
jgi:hypothetical protein